MGPNKPVILLQNLRDRIKERDQFTAEDLEMARGLAGQIGSMQSKLTYTRIKKEIAKSEAEEEQSD
ncbi:hypothetical protein [Pontibacillus salipaludis]|uniref:Uncharacterized protein n=1 Tax=Pontibacillus salipaludis TaxID=1697394 RepID=A0ABQ1PZS9_9BACI|nr:hypothetical protein [Pontibacillus salipaludis]GGD07739.1 hypothetical protein GCM10011389_14080 [Pontibacillus salipaludis]